MVFQQGDLGDSVYVIEEGECDVLQDHDGSEKLLATLKGGDYFGEMALLSDKSRNATIRARTATNVLIIPKGDFDKLRHSVPAFGEIFRALAKKRARRPSIRRILRELEIRQPDALIDDLIGVDVGGRFEAGSAGGGDEIVLIDAVAADAEAAHQHAVLIQRQRAGKKHDAVLIRIRRLSSPACTDSACRIDTAGKTDPAPCHRCRADKSAGRRSRWCG